MLFPDFLAETRQKRCLFTDVCKKMKDKGLQYSMLYFSKLRVQYQGLVKFFFFMGVARTGMSEEASPTAPASDL